VYRHLTVAHERDRLGSELRRVGLRTVDVDHVRELGDPAVERRIQTDTQSRTDHSRVWLIRDDLSGDRAEARWIT